MTATAAPCKTRARLITIEEFSKMPNPEDGSQQDLVKGVIVTMPPPQGEHGYLVAHVGYLINQYVIPEKIGWVCAGDVGVVIQRGPDTLRGVDVAYWSIKRQKTRPKGYMKAPDLAVEILSPNWRRKQVLDKVRDYIDIGVKLVWFVDPESRTVTVYAGTQRGVEHDENDTIDGGDVLPGFTCKVSELI